MNLRNSFAVMAIAGALAACATTQSERDTASAGPHASTGRPTSQVTSTAVGGETPKGQLTGGAQREVSSGGADRPDPRHSVYYEFDRYDVKAEYRALIESHARWLRANPQARLAIEGNTDERGSREYNVALGQRRAESVSALMRLHGVRPEQIEAVSFGKEKPRTTGHDEAAWAENRRSDFAER